MFRRLFTWIKRLLFTQQQREEPPPCWFLRIAKAQRWQQNETGTSPTVEDAVKDIMLREDEKGLSLYRLNNGREVDKLACVFSLTLRDNPKHFECVIFPESLLSGYQVNAAPVREHPQFLSERHYEILEPSETQLLELAERILNSPDKQVLRIKKQQIVDLTIRYGWNETGELRGRIGDKWLGLIERKKTLKRDA